MMTPSMHNAAFKDLSTSYFALETETGAGAGLSGAPPTDTGPTGGGSGGSVLGSIFRDARMSRARACGRGMPAVVLGMLEVVNGGVRASTCTASAES
jgi:hypothetical protein